MERITDQNTTYVIESTNDITSENSDTQQLVFVDTPILICSDNGAPPLHIPPVCQKGRVFQNHIVKKLPAIKRLFKTVKCNDTENKIARNHPMNEEPVVLHPTSTRKKLSYETEFKPSKPSTKGSYKGFIRYGRRQLIVDQQIMISTRQFKNQLMDTEDVITESDLAPRSKQQMQRLLNGITKLFAYPAHKVPSSQLLQLYVANCTSNEKPNVETVTDMELLPIGYQSPINPSTKRRISRKRKSPDMQQETNESKKDNTEIEILVEAEIFTNDHKYSKQIFKEKILETELEKDNCKKEDNEIITQLGEPIKTEIEIDGNDVFTIKDNEVYTLKSDDTDDREVVIIQRLGENLELSHKNLEVLLAAANDTNQIVAICNSSDFADNRYILIQKDDDEENFV